MTDPTLQKLPIRQTHLDANMLLSMIYYVLLYIHAIQIF